MTAYDETVYTFHRMIGMVVPHPKTPQRFEIRCHLDKWHYYRVAIVATHAEAAALCERLNAVHPATTLET